MTQPVAILGGIEELRQRCLLGHDLFSIMLAGGMARSGKTIDLRGDTWSIWNDIDDTAQDLTDAELWTESHIGEALDKGALLDLMGNNGIVHVKDRGWIALDVFEAEARASWEAAAAEARKDDGPLVYRIHAAPGSIRMGEDADADWEPADPSLVLEPCEIGPHTVASIDIAAVCRGFLAPYGGERCSHAATTSIELTIEDIDQMVAALLAIKEDAIANRGFALGKDGYWTNGEE
jgi:hypothetical protein